MYTLDGHSLLFLFSILSCLVAKFLPLFDHFADKRNGKGGWRRWQDGCAGDRGHGDGTPSKSGGRVWREEVQAKGAHQALGK